MNCLSKLHRKLLLFDVIYVTILILKQAHGIFFGVFFKFVLIGRPGGILYRVFNYAKSLEQEGDSLRSFLKR